ncbi:MAG: hypothetical protein Q9218_000707 [Villophora microphyllina]
MATWNGHRGPRQRNQPARTNTQNTASEMALTPKLNTRIREYVKGSKASSYGPSFVHEREIPTSDEISVPDDGEAVEIQVNQVVGPWQSREKYLSDHYALLREDGVAPLRNVVSEVKAEPHILEKDSMENAQIYEKVFIVGLTFAQSGVAAKVTFSLRRAEKKIVWEQSKRLQQGTIVALTPAHDMFNKICKVAVVAARPLSGVQANPPEVDIFFASPDEIEFDPQQEWVMVESNNGYFEAYRHTLKSLQKLTKEAFPLANYIVGVERDIRPPWYLQKQPSKDLSSLFPGTGSMYDYMDILDGQWPDDPTSDLDASQVAALRRILRKELAIVQGPPGTESQRMRGVNESPSLHMSSPGKTHVSVVALKVLLENKRTEDPPIIVAAHTNHALDQLLRHIAPIEPEFIRLGGMSLDEEIIRPRTLHEVKQATKMGNVPGGMKGSSLSNIRKLIKDMHTLLKPLTEGVPLSEEVFKEYGILDDHQCKSLIEGAAAWIDTSLPNAASAAISKWTSGELVQAKNRTMPEDFLFEYEEVDLEYEQLKEIEAEGKVSGDDDFEALKGEKVTFNEPWTGQERADGSKDDFESLLAKRDLWQIPSKSRGPLYRYMQQRVKKSMLEKLRRMMREYERYAIDLKIGKWEVDTNYLAAAKIIGCTTTGLSKYRPLLDSLKPKIVLVEEAAETLEPFVTAACFETLEHLILVGDHQQLRGHCNEKELEGPPWFLDVSMFERLVRNQVGFTQLTRQRRMHPEIRRALMPIYPHLEDHPSVKSREPVLGMGGLTTFFFSHDWLEDTDQLMSKVNRTEAVMIVGYFNYLVNNGMHTKDITVLTFYNGQRKLILTGLRAHPNLQGEKFKVVTVDSYQGEENGVVLLSLVRSNENINIGFLSAANRVCVALSRAQRGFYIFGNARMICKASILWFEVVQAMCQGLRRVGFFLPLTYPDYFNDNAGGCEDDCRAELPCRHVCALKCHPFLHDKVLCYKRCSRILACGHQCKDVCHAPCSCKCGVEPVKKAPSPAPIFSYENSFQGATRGRSHARSSPSKTPRGSPTKRPLQPSIKPQSRSPTKHPQVLVDLTPEAQAFREFAAGGHVQADAAAIAAANEAAAKEQLRRLDEENAAALFGDPVDTSLAARTNKLKLTATRQTTDGTTRNTYEGIYNNPNAGSSSHKQEPSLLD